MKHRDNHNRRHPAQTNSIMIKSKSYESKVAEVSGDGIVTIAIAAFDNTDSYGDIIRPGAFKKTFAERGKRQNHFLDHDLSIRSLVGLPLRMYETPNHAVVESQLNLKKQLSIDLYEDYKFFQANDRTLEHSFMYETLRRNENKDIKGEDIAEVKMYEYSTVGLGANENTPLLDLKSYKDIDMLVYELESRLRKCNYTDERGKAVDQLIQALKVYQVPVQSTPADQSPQGAGCKSVMELIEGLAL